MIAQRRTVHCVLFVIAVILLSLHLCGKALLAQAKDKPRQDEAVKEPLRLNPVGAVTFLAFSPDGKTLAFGLSPFGVDGEGSKVEAATVLINVADGKEKLRIPAEKLLLPYTALFSPDGKFLVIGQGNAGIALYDPETGKRLRTVDGAASMGQPLVFSPDGKILAATLPLGGPQEPGVGIYLWDLETGKEIRHFGGKPHGEVSRFAFAEDGKTVVAEHRLLVSIEGTGRHGTSNYKVSAHLWECATGKDLGSIGSVTDWKGPANHMPLGGVKFREIGAGGEDAFKTPWGSMHPAAYYSIGYRLGRCSNDAFFLLPAYRLDPLGVAGGRSGLITLFTPVSGTELAQLPSLEGAYLTTIVVSPDSKYLAACGQFPQHGSSTIFLWDLTSLPKPDLGKELKAGPSELASWWADLASANNSNANQAMRRFVLLPDKTVAFLKERLPPATMPDGAAKLIGQLDDDDPKTREMATQHLMRAGLTARPDLEKALRDSPSAEKKRRITDILAAIPKDSRAEEVQGLRAIDVLEHIGSEDAKVLLTKLQGGVADAPLTLAAKAALVRIKDAAPSKP